MPSVHDYIDDNLDRYVEELKDFLKIPSVSSDSKHKEDVRRAAEWLGGKMEEAGIRVEMHDTSGHPILTGEKMDAGDGAPTVLVYGHFDVQPPDPLDLWESGPFEPVVKGGDLVARGSADDKGQVYIYVKAAEAFQKSGAKLPVNMKFVIEGEEEVGSPNLGPFVTENKDRLSCNAVLVSDTAMFSPDHPSLTVGLRGLCYMEVKFTGPNRDLHSGSYGGAVENPAIALARFIAGLKDDKERVTIPGFYDKVRDLTDEERKNFAALPHDEEAFKKDLGVKALAGEEGYTTVERKWARPSLDVNGMISGFTGEGAKTIIPSWASAKISMRLVPDQDPLEIAELFESHVRKAAPDTVAVEVVRHHGGKPSVVSPENPAMQAAMAAVEKSFGKKPLLQREGGSIPIVAVFEEELDAPVILMGFGLPDDRIHSPNEKFTLKNYYRGIHTVAQYLEEFPSG
jgi:acetylornithine deacetylase/succinyl-diaminopimelate desuccinylase-like protein